METDEMPPDGDSNIMYAMLTATMQKPEGSVVAYLVLLLFLIGLNAFFAMSELAIVSLNDNKIRNMAKNGDKKALKLLQLIENPTNFLSTIQIGVTLSGFLASAVAADTFAERIVYGMRNLAISPSLVRGIALIVITILLSFVTLVFGELVPKRVAMQNYEKISFAIIGILSGLTTIFKPMVFLVSSVTNGVLRLIGIDPDQKPEEITEEEIRLMLDVGKESGHIEESEKDMIDNIFEFDDRVVGEIMTHRTEMEAVEVDAPLSEVVETAVSSGYSRIPVFEEDLDNIIGVLYVKDLLNFLGPDAPQYHIQDFMREPMFVIESTVCRNLLAQFQETTIQMAIVVDEYGGTAGLVTMEDLLEAIVGNIQDEYDDEEEEILILSESEYIVDGLTDILTIDRFFSLGLSEDELDDFDTISGYITSLLGQIPAEGEFPSVIVSNVQFTVREMNERRIAKFDVLKLPTPPPEPEEDEKEKRQRWDRKDRPDPDDDALEND